MIGGLAEELVYVLRNKRRAFVSDVSKESCILTPVVSFHSILGVHL